MGKVYLQNAGLYTSIQDLGRSGYRNFGVPDSGAMDRKSAQRANMLVNNPPNTPLLEITLVGPNLKFQSPCIIALSGADLSPTLDGKRVGSNYPVLVRNGQTLSFGKPQYGIRAYLAVHGGFQNDKILGSASQYYPITQKSKLENKEILEFTDRPLPPLPNTSVKVDMDHFENSEIKVFPGPEFDLLTKDHKKGLLEYPLTIGENNRMGYQLLSEKNLQNDFNIITFPVIPGTVQLTPSGKLIALMRDGQVTGGYPRVLQLSKDSINRLAQKSTGTQINFSSPG